MEDLGGLRKPKLWEAAKARIEARATAPRKEVKRKGPAWLYIPEHIAESERLKACKRACLKAGQNPRVVLDRCKVDVEGDFRLASCVLRLCRAGNVRRVKCVFIRR